MIAYVFQKYPENFLFQLFTILQSFTPEICYFLPICPFINSFYFLFCLKTKLYTKISVFAFCDEASLYLLFYNLYDCTFKVFEVLSK